MTFAQSSGSTRSITSKRTAFALGAALLAATSATAMAEPTSSRPATQTASAAGETVPASARASETHLPASTPVRGEGTPVLPRSQRPATPVAAPAQTEARITSDADDAVWAERARTVLDGVSIPAGFGGSPDAATLTGFAQSFGWVFVPADLGGLTSDAEFADAALRAQP